MTKKINVLLFLIACSFNISAKTEQIIDKNSLSDVVCNKLNIHDNDDALTVDFTCTAPLDSVQMIIKRQAKANQYYFIGQTDLTTQQGTQYHFTFMVENGILTLANKLNPDIKLFQQTLFTLLTEKIKTDSVMIPQQKVYLKYESWLPLTTDLRLAISNIDIQEIDCPEPAEINITPEQVKQYFTLSTEYTYIDRGHLHDFDFYSCGINGELLNHNQKTSFTIDIGGIAYLGERVFGCAANRCDQLNIGMGTDGMLAD